MVGRLELEPLAVQIGENFHLGAQYGCIDRFMQIIDGARSVALEDVLVLVVIRGQEDDRNTRRSLARLDHLRQLQSGHPGHADVQDQQRKIFRHQCQ